LWIRIKKFSPKYFNERDKNENNIDMDNIKIND